MCLLICLSLQVQAQNISSPVQADSGSDFQKYQDTIRLELQEAIRLGIERSVNAIVAKNEYISAYWTYRTYKTELLPEFVLNGTLPYYSNSYNMRQNDDGSYTYVENNYFQLNGGLSVSQNIPWSGGRLTLGSQIEFLRQNGKNPFNRYYALPLSVTLEQPLFGFNRLGWLRKIEPVRYQEARQKMVSDREEVSLTVINYYFNLLLGRINLEIALQNRENAEKLYAIAEARHRIGQLSEVELLQMKSSRLSAEAALTDMQTSFDSRMFQLRSFLGFGEGLVLDAVIPEFPTENIPRPAYTEVLQLAHENNAFTKSVQRRLLEASQNVAQAKADRRSITMTASFGLAGQEDIFRQAYDRNNWRSSQLVQVGISIPILDWGKGKARVRTAESRREVVNSQIEKEQMDFNQNIFLCVQNFNNQPGQLELAKEMDEIALKRYNTTIEAFIQGKMDILNLNDSQSQKDAARRNYIEQMFLLWSYYYQIRALTLYDFILKQPLEVEYPEN
jgi:outer membrane protein TolC